MLLKFFSSIWPLQYTTQIILFWFMFSQGLLKEIQLIEFFTTDFLSIYQLCKDVLLAEQFLQGVLLITRLYFWLNKSKHNWLEIEVFGTVSLFPWLFKLYCHEQVTSFRVYRQLITLKMRQIYSIYRQSPIFFY